MLKVSSCFMCMHSVEDNVCANRVPSDLKSCQDSIGEPSKLIFCAQNNKSSTNLAIMNTRLLLSPILKNNWS